MIRYCTCGHTEGWHTRPALRLSLLELFARAINWVPLPGSRCEICDECSGFAQETVWTEMKERR